MNEIREQVGVHSSKPQHVVGTHGSCVRSARSKWTSGHIIGADARAVRPYMQVAQIKITTINMEKMECKKRAYTTPEMMVYPMENDNLLQAVSGQHKHIGQGGSFGNAKRGSDEEWEEASPNPSEGGENTLPSYNVWEE
ncbi:hypothetical protein [Segatella maculosa]|uniref:hypothetical protein n=1 Tax=Segatella maculosa TaxID=439703 RepID=UPI00035FD67B|nr:hypothetical protein [Segatella maculosa]